MTSVATFSGRDVLSGEGKTLHLRDGRIAAVTRCDEADLPLLSPGFVDLQVNGFGGHDLNDGRLTPEAVEALCKALVKVGVAAFLPTLITASEAALCQRLSAIRRAQETLPLAGKMIAGIHVEGPSISPKDGPRGAHPLAHVRPPATEEFARWQDAAGGLVRMVTLAPETAGATTYIKALADRGICVALGHCDATEEDIARAVAAGARMSTHLGNGIAATLPRHPNAIWAQLSDDRLTASLILDGHHLSRATARAMIRAKGDERVVLVSDSVKFAGMAPGRYQSPIGGDVEVSDCGQVAIAGTEYLAGSGACLLDIVCGYQAFTGFPATDALRMATVNPARMIGRDLALSPGAPANFLLFQGAAADGRLLPAEIVFDGVSVRS
ncbi:MAG: amidohydrolase family protein [Marinovum algicola]|uniref:N-acetylglucosamine-6-phosphate deacetylase n=1 Tax=Marinovum algicola TaxID=42444 RepID=A0A975ZPX1_9RHOB|nr:MULTISPECIES: amidohydrolase family protein [Marinovum]MDD9744933.1 amidohydrolase family protein [Marinovum sp. PR37]SEJ97604.1 N-acetylglucosamine-6-phosphate deacetylase [Marinovum algicola]SLN69912.1 N-acetylglucosamine-6-phosphate deacetylase [Marinovum algicola]